MEDIRKKVLEFYARGKAKVLQGKVSIRGMRIEDDIAQRRVTHLKPLYFEPSLETADVNRGCLQALLEYLQTYYPVTERGLVFFPDHGIGLYMQEEKPWSPAEVIDVFDHSQSDMAELEEVIRLLQEKKVSSFVMGRARERQDYNGYTVLRRHFKE
jgi:hypothetical protein